MDGVLSAARCSYSYMVPTNGGGLVSSSDFFSHFHFLRPGPKLCNVVILPLPLCMIRLSLGLGFRALLEIIKYFNIKERGRKRERDSEIERCIGV